MKAIILAAGKGTRMLPLTEKIPKVLVEVSGRPFLWYVLQNLRQAGFHELGIVVGYLGDQIEFFLHREKIKAAVIPQEKQLGTGHALLQAKAFCGNENFVVLGGDNLFSVEDLKQAHKHDAICYVAGKELTDYKKYGILLTEQDKSGQEKLLKIIEKPQQFVGNLVNVGLYKFTPEIWAAMEQVNVSLRGEYELTDAITLLAQQGKVNVLRLKEYWLDLGSREDIPGMEEFLGKSF